jgi:alpha-L-rhamnosidase
MLRVSKVRLNYMEECNGSIEMPQLSWQIESDIRNTEQKTYQVQVAEDVAFRQILHDSGEVTAEESNGIQIAISLKTACRYFLRVKIESKQGEWTKWSEPQTFFSGIIQNRWQGKFITIEKDEDASQAKGTYLRTEIQVAKNIRAAYVYTTALGLYHFYINGEKIGQDEMTPGWTSYHKHLMYQSYEVTELLKQGGNVLAAHIGAGWYKGLMSFNHIRNIYGKKTAFLAELHVQYEDGSQAVFATDASWQGRYSPVLFSEIYDGEIYDARQEKAGWNCAGFKGLWESVQLVDYDFSRLDPQYASKPGYNDKVLPKRLFYTKKQELVLDFGQNMTGWVEFSVKGEPGDKIILKCFEVLDQDGNAYFANLRAAKQTIEYICKGGEEKFHPNFTYQGFQYVQIVSYPGNPQIDDFCAYTIHSVMKPTGSFACSNKLVNQLQHNIVWGLKGNFLDVPTDCPQRDERLGWTGDAQIFSRTACFLMNAYAFYAKWLKDLEADQTPDGGVPHVVPDLLTGYSEHDQFMKEGTHSASAWADAAVIIPWSMYLTFGDKKIIKQQYESMKKWIDFMHAHEDANGSWSYKLQFGDWVALDAEEGSYFGATPNDLVCAAYYAYSTGLFAKMAKNIGKVEDAKLYQKRYECIVEQYQKRFFDEDGDLRVKTQTAHVISLYFHLTAKQYIKKTASKLVDLIKKENGHLVTGFVGTPYICHALSENGYTKEAWDLLLKEDFPSWLYQVKKGATTIWEHWDGLKEDGSMWSPDMNSFNHYAYGAIGEWLYRKAAGIEIDEQNPGYKHIIFQPCFGGDMDFVEASYDSVYGKVGIHWEIAGDEGSVRICVPVNTRADLVLAQVEGIIEADGLEFANKDGLYTAQTGSGTYRIRFRKN